MSAARPRRLLVLLPLLAIVACRTPNGPKIGLPTQDIATTPSAGLVRVVFFNTSDKILYPASGSVRIQVDGSSVPTVHHDQYVQIHLPPGPHHLLLEHWDMVVFTSEYDVQIQGSDQYFEVYSHPFSTQFKEVAALPADFRSRWRPAKTPETW